MERRAGRSHFETFLLRVRSRQDGKTRWFPVLMVARGDVAGVRPTWEFWQMGKGEGRVSSRDETREGKI